MFFAFPSGREESQEIPRSLYLISQSALSEVAEVATDEEENKYLIEMQNANDHDIRQRLVYYSCRLVDQMGQHNSKWDYGLIK